MSVDVVRELAARLTIDIDKAKMDLADARLNKLRENVFNLDKAGRANLRLKELQSQLSKLGTGAKVAGAGVQETSSGIGGMLAGLVGVSGAAAVAAAAIAGAKKFFLDFNSTVQQSTISMSAQEMMFKKTSWADSMQTATGLFEHYQEVAKKSVGTTQDFVDMHKGIGAAAYQAGASMEDLKAITEGAVVAGMSLGESAFTSSMDIKQALTKGVEVRDRFMNLVLASQNTTMAKFNAMSKKQRVEFLRGALTAPVFKEAAKEMEGSFAGVMSTLQDTLQIALGKVGKPLFEAITKEIKVWNQWLEKNPAFIKNVMGRGLREVLSSLKLIASVVRPIVWAFSKLGEAYAWLEKKAETSSLAAAIKAILSPVTTTWRILQDIAYFLMGKGSRLGLSIAKSQGKAAEDSYIRDVVYGKATFNPFLRKVVQPGEKVGNQVERMIAGPSLDEMRKNAGAKAISLGDLGVKSPLSIPGGETGSAGWNAIKWVGGLFSKPTAPASQTENKSVYVNAPVSIDISGMSSSDSSSLTSSLQSSIDGMFRQAAEGLVSQ